MAATAAFAAAATITAASAEEYDCYRPFLNHLNSSSSSCLTHNHLLPLRRGLFFPHRKLTPIATITKTTKALVSSSSSIPGFWLNVGEAARKENVSHSRRLSSARKENVPHSRRLSSSLAVRHLTGSLTATEGLRFAVVVARFNEIVTKPLLEGALETFKKYSVKEENIDVVWVPGSFEIAVVAERLGKSHKYQAILCIGAVVRGDTTHYDAVANSAASGVLSAGLSSGVPCIFGVLTCDNMDQALNRAGGKSGNKGSEAALTAIEMASLFEHHLK